MLIEAKEPDLAEVEPPPGGPGAACLLAQDDARRLLATREVEHGDVLVAPRDERELGEHRGRPEILVGLDLPQHRAVPREGEQRRTLPRRSRQGQDSDFTVVAYAVENEPSRRPCPEFRARGRIE